MLRSHLSAAVALCLCAAPALGEVLVVSSAANAGAGTLRAALKSAEQSSVPVVISIETDHDIQISETLVYAGRAPLSIFGSDQAITTQQNFTLLAVSEGADLRVSNLSFQGPGGFNVNARAIGAPGKGLFVDVRSDQTGTVALTLEGVTVSGVAGPGVHVSDCNLADNCGGGGGGAGAGSLASISLDLRNVVIRDVGNGSIDEDGVRVDERGAGNIIARIDGSAFSGNGGDGVELDEGQDGSVIAHVLNSQFDANGIYCDPRVLNVYLPEPAEASFKKGRRTRKDIPGLVIGAPDDGCFEREVDLYNDGSVEYFEFSIDVEDGFDIDEAGAGDINAVLFDTTNTRNLDEGVDFDEQGAGHISFSVVGGRYHENSDDGVKLSEEDAGDISVDLLRTSAAANGGNGFSFQEEDRGDLTVNAVRVVTGGNDDSDQTGIEVEQYDKGQGELNVIASDIADGIDGYGVTVNEQ